MISITGQISNKAKYRAKVSLQYIKKQLPTAPCKVSSLLFPMLSVAMPGSLGNQPHGQVAANT